MLRPETRGGRLCLPNLFAVVSLLTLTLRIGAMHEQSALSAFNAHLSGPLLPNWNSSSTPLCSWAGITCNNNLSVTAINLSGRNLTGELNNDIIRHLTHLESLDLSDNKISGPIPSDIFSSASLRYLNLSNNNFTGSIPRAAAAGLVTLDLSNNALTGEIPDSIGMFSKLEYMDIGGNLFVGEVPETLANMTNLRVLTLASNQLTGPVPRGLSNMKKLKVLYLGYNNFSGQIPAEIGLLTSMNHLDLVLNNLSGEIPSSIGNLSNLEYLFLYRNSLSGPIPESIFTGLKKLVSLDLSDNLLSGEVPEKLGQLQQLEILQLFSNRFSGKIPRAAAYLPRLRVLQLWDNKFTGRIPAELGKHCNLTVLDLSTNFLTGKIPEHLCHLSVLSKLILFSNSLFGRIPKGLGMCKTLSRIRLENNSLSGEVPAEFWRLPLVQYLDISGNKLTGRIDEVKWDMKSLMMVKMGRNKFFGGLPESFGSEVIENVDISDNELSGNIPRSVGNMSQLVQLKLRGNKLTGTIPYEMSLCRKLVYLDLNHNQLSGRIPGSIGALPVLDELDLSENELSGEIPSILGEMDSLVKVNISHNHLHGSLPLGGPFLAIESSSVIGNHLCENRSPKTSGLPLCPNRRNPTQWWLLVLGVIIVLVVAILAFLLVVFVIRRRDGSEPRRVKSEDGLWEVQFFDSKSSKTITIDDILDHKKKSIVARGSNWSSYKGKSKASGKEFIVTHWNGLSSVSSILFTALNEIGKSPNQKAVKMIGICRSELDGCLILHECDEGKSLLEALPSLNWEARKNVARGLAKALQAVHSCTHVPLVDLSPEMITVDDENEPSLHVILPAADAHQTALTDVVHNLAEGVAKREDIYSFGIILIVLLSGIFPSESKFGAKQMTIVEWAHCSFCDLSKTTWLDSLIAERVERSELMDMMKLALRCTTSDPAQRPSATEVCELLNILCLEKC